MLSFGHRMYRPVQPSVQQSVRRSQHPAAIRAAVRHSGDIEGDAP
ncbi:hypothetical protein STXM2123_4460 [Streptomyces sp. F-3]|nr:hypothetical protein STXM2123_4460 [Streptomyces sp. F-3]